MTSQSATSGSRRPSVTPELGLAILAVLTFFVIPLRFNTIYSGLPAHPLFLHIPVILIPVAAIGAIVLAIRPHWYDPHGLWLGLIAVIALGALNLTMSAGSALRADLGLGGEQRFNGHVVPLAGPGSVVSLVAQHAHAAGILRALTILFTAIFLVTVAAARSRTGHDTGVGGVDRTLRAVSGWSAGLPALRVASVLLAIGCLVFVFRTGDLGAKAVWQSRLAGSHGGFIAPPGGVPQPGAPSGG